MGCCMSSSQLDVICNKISDIENKMVSVEELISENKRLRRATIEMRMRIENYGMILSGNPCRVTPQSYEISKRLGLLTV